jgi:hypothetical protein
MAMVVGALQELQVQMSAGHLKAAINHGKLLLDDQTFTADLGTYAHLCCLLASTLGRAESAQAERDLLLRAEARLRAASDPKGAQYLVELRWKLAYHFWNTLHYDDALHWIEQALDAAGETAASDRLEWVVAAANLKARILHELALHEEVAPQNALVLTYAAVWGQPGWAADYLVGNQRLELPLTSGTLFDAGIASSLQSVRLALAEAKTFRPNRLSELKRKLLEAWDTEDVVTLGECWGRLSLHAAETQTLGSAEAERWHDLLQRLLPLRAGRLRLDLTAQALERVTPGSELSAELHQLRLSLTQLQLANVRRPSHRPRLVLNYRQALSKAISAGVVRDPQALLFHIHYAKHLDLTGNLLGDDSAESSSPTAALPAASLPRFSETETSLAGRLLAEERELLPSEQGSLDIDALRQRLGLEQAAFLDFFIGSTEGSSRLVAVFGDELKVFPLQLSRERLAQTLASIRKIAAQTAHARITSEGEAFDALSHSLSPGDPRWQQCWREVSASLQRLGAALLPPEALKFTEQANLLYLAPHGRLHAIPLHALPIGEFPSLIQRHPVLYVPKASYLLHRVNGAPKLQEPYVCVNVADPDIGGKAFLKLFPNGGAINHWADALPITARLDELSRFGSAWFFLHGYSSKAHYGLYRLALPKGQRLTVTEVESFPHTFHGTAIYLFACGSGRPTITRSYEFLGLASVFLRKGAECVLSSLWSPEASVAITFARVFLAAQARGQTRVAAFQSAVKTVMQGHWLHGAGFVLHGHEEFSEKR